MHIRIMRCVKMLDVDKRDFIVLAVLVSPCVGFAVTGNTAGAKQVLRRPFLGGEGKPWVILEKRFLFYKPTSSGIPLWHVLIVFPSMACPKLWSGKFGCVFGCVWYVWSVHDECVFVLRAFVCCFFLLDVTSPTCSFLWGFWQLSLRGLSSPVTSSALDEIWTRRLADARDVLGQKKSSKAQVFWSETRCVHVTFRIPVMRSKSGLLKRKDGDHLGINGVINLSRKWRSSLSTFEKVDEFEILKGPVTSILFFYVFFIWVSTQDTWERRGSWSHFFGFP